MKQLVDIWVKLNNTCAVQMNFGVFFLFKTKTAIFTIFQLFLTLVSKVTKKKKIV